EAFVLRLYREANPTGFIKAITDRRQGLTPRGGFGIERILRTLFVPGLFLLPARFMRAWPPAWTPARHRSSLARPRAGRQRADGGERADSRFDQLLRSYTDPVWHRMSYRSRQLVADIRTLRRFLLALTQ
uniref:DUF4070 domain-containing protein n=1 Tax=Macrostomum lignano TaxID=282301 RepID=A0A1I8FQ68_9PLAT